MNKQQLKGRISQVRGKAKSVVGRLFGNRSMETKGRVENAGGKIRSGYGDLKDDNQKQY